mgnify:CR=1 FL=1
MPEKSTVTARKRKSLATTQRFLPVAEIRNNTLILKNGGLRAVIEVEALNFNLKSETEQQGIIADRPNEHLGQSDGGIILQRKIFREALADIAAGRDPLAIIRDPAKQYVELAFKSDMMKERVADAHYAAGFGREPAAAAE